MLYRYYYFCTLFFYRVAVNITSPSSPSTVTYYHINTSNIFCDKKSIP